MSKRGIRGMGKRESADMNEAFEESKAEEKKQGLVSGYLTGLWGRVGRTLTRSQLGMYFL